jgi:anti-sigma factor RsiW
MTPQLTTQHGIGDNAPGEQHLTGEQFCELMAGYTKAAGAESTPAEAHVKACEQCSAELASLREAVTLFREASSAYADEELRSRPRWEIPARRVFTHRLVPAYWVAAAAMFLTALLPLQVLRRHSVAPLATVATSTTDGVADRSAQSDEALLEDVNSEISASVPTSMQALADPSNDETVADNESPVPTSNQRKD